MLVTIVIYYDLQNTRKKEKLFKVISTYNKSIYLLTHFLIIVCQFLTSRDVHHA